MGWKPPTKIYRIEPGGDYEGLQVRIKSVPIGQYMALTDLAEDIDAETGTAATSGKLGNVFKLFEAMADALVSWNIDDEYDNPLPATLDGLQSLDFDLALYLIGEWIGAMGGVSDPLGKRQSDSELSSVPDSLDLEAASQPL